MRPNLSPKAGEMGFAVAQAMNRHERRRLQKINGVKIPGSSKPAINTKKNAKAR